MANQWDCLTAVTRLLLVSRTTPSPVHGSLTLISSSPFHRRLRLACPRPTLAGIDVRGSPESEPFILSISTLDRELAELRGSQQSRPSNSAPYPLRSIQCSNAFSKQLRRLEPSCRQSAATSMEHWADGRRTANRTANKEMRFLVFLSKREVRRYSLLDGLTALRGIEHRTAARYAAMNPTGDYLVQSGESAKGDRRPGLLPRDREIAASL